MIWETPIDPGEADIEAPLLDKVEKASEEAKKQPGKDRFTDLIITATPQLVRQIRRQQKRLSELRLELVHLNNNIAEEARLGAEKLTEGLRANLNATRQHNQILKDQLRDAKEEKQALLRYQASLIQTIEGRQHPVPQPDDSDIRGPRRASRVPFRFPRS